MLLSNMPREVFDTDILVLDLRMVCQELFIQAGNLKNKLFTILLTENKEHFLTCLLQMWLLSSSSPSSPSSTAGTARPVGRSGAALPGEELELLPPLVIPVTPSSLLSRFR